MEEKVIPNNAVMTVTLVKQAIEWCRIFVNLGWCLMRYFHSKLPDEYQVFMVASTATEGLLSCGLNKGIGRVSRAVLRGADGFTLRIFVL
ncbi:hypothetical protein [Pectobacterium versatile]|uniref:hypothetical protein n=1 Tax=Pectobacterium versatile TaxID=2488639 RepID=UPI001F28EF13|nr:hypothetical protein [Pectobacterium versatile]